MNCWNGRRAGRAWRRERGWVGFGPDPRRPARQREYPGREHNASHGHLLLVGAVGTSERRPVDSRVGFGAVYYEMACHGRGHARVMPRRPLRCSHFGCLAVPPSTAPTARSPGGPPCGSASPCWPSWPSSIPAHQPRQAGRRSLARERHRRGSAPPSRVALHPPLGPGRRLGARHRRRPPAESPPPDLRSLGASRQHSPGMSPTQPSAIYHGPFLERFPSQRGGGIRALGRSGTLEHGPPVRPGDRAVGGAGECGAATWYGRSNGGRAWRARIPYNSRIALRYMQALEAAGDRAGALRHARRIPSCCGPTWTPLPSAEVIALAERLKLESRAASAERPPPPTRARPLRSARPVGRRPILDSGSPPVVAARPTRRRWVARLSAVPGIGGRSGSAGRRALARAGTAAGSPPSGCRPLREPHWTPRARRPRRDGRGLDRPRTDGDAALQRARCRGGLRGGKDDSGRPMDPLSWRARTARAWWCGGATILSGDSVLFQAGIMDVASGRMLRSFDPVGAPIERATDALEALRERIAAGLSPLVNRDTGAARSIPTWRRRRTSPHIASSSPGSRQGRFDDWESEADYYRRAARLDSTFAAPLIQLAFRAFCCDHCAAHGLGRCRAGASPGATDARGTG